MATLRRAWHAISSSPSVIRFPAPADPMRGDLRFVVLADSSHPPATSHGISGLLTFLMYRGHAYYISWVSHKQRRVSHSSYAAEVLALAEGDEEVYHLNLVFEELHIPAVGALGTDSRTAFDCSTTDHLARDLRARATVAGIRDNWIAGTHDIMSVEGKHNMSDAGTKRNYEMWSELHTLMASGKPPVLPTFQSGNVRGRAWARL